MAANGRLPASALAPITGGLLRKDAAAAWNTMNVLARRVGVELHPTGSRSSYRPYVDQVYFWNLYQSGKGNLSAVPGSSNHGMGTAVDVATPAMRATIDRIGRTYGWAKAWSDAPSEWWHLAWRVGVWSGPDPGPAGITQPAPAPIPPQLPEGTVAIDVATMKDGRFEVFVEDKNGNVWHAWQAKEGGWAGAVKGKKNASWYSLGTPGK